MPHGYNRPMLASMVASSSPTNDLPNRPVEVLDLARYLGQWHEIAHLPMFFQCRCADRITATYGSLPGGRIRVSNACRQHDGRIATAEGIARPAGNAAGALKVRFAPGWLAWLPWVWADYWIVEHDPAYQWAVVGSPGRRYLWILSREPSMEGTLFRAIIDRSARRGYAIDRLVMAAPLH
ncbi:lipocalin family protein [Dyella sp.]|uniref:lipocalin family protein n=1 Tax=Dyella sp. TaxID=1869338 RepID=UPI002ECFB9ED